MKAAVIHAGEPAYYGTAIALGKKHQRGGL